MIKNTTTFTLGMILSIVLCTTPVSLKGHIFSRNAPAGDIIGAIDTGLQEVLDDHINADEATQNIKNLDEKVGDLIDKLLKYLVEEFTADSGLIHNKVLSGQKIQKFCIDYFAKLGAIKSIQYSALLMKLKEEFKKYTPEQFYKVVMTSRHAKHLQNDVKALAALQSLKEEQRIKEEHQRNIRPLTMEDIERKGQAKQEVEYKILMK